ncbi:MAG: protein-disulfide reductase DsbD domain-containing protein [Chitinophagales bacterium]
MKRYLIVLTLLLFGSLLEAQQLNQNDATPVTWEIELEQLSDNEFMLTFIANISNGWYIYSQHIEDEGPEPTTFIFNQNPSIELGSAVREFGEMKEMYDEVYQVKVKKYADKVTFKTIVKVFELYTVLDGHIRFMSCESAGCLPPEEVPFEFRF